MFVSVWSVVRISWPSSQCPRLLHLQTSTLHHELVHAFCLRRCPVCGCECVTVLQLCVTLAGLDSVVHSAACCPGHLSLCVTWRDGARLILLLACVSLTHKSAAPHRLQHLHSWARTTSETLSTRPSSPQASGTSVLSTRLLERESNPFMRPQHGLVQLTSQLTPSKHRSRAVIPPAVLGSTGESASLLPKKWSPHPVPCILAVPDAISVASVAFVGHSRNCGHHGTSWPFPALAVYSAESVVVLHVVLAVLHDLQVVFPGISSSLWLQRQPRTTEDIGYVVHFVSMRGLQALEACELLRSATTKPPPASSLK